MEHLLTADIVDKNKRSNFYYSFLLLPKPKREAMNVLYAWCRVADDIVDDEGQVSAKRQRLLSWAKEFEKGLDGASAYALVNRLAAIIRRFNIPAEHFRELIRGMEMDLLTVRYATFADLRVYCYRAASTVGLISTEIFGYHREEAKEYAVNLGIALQLTNILRDVAADAAKGRIYLPKEDMERFGYTEDELLAGVYNGRFRALMEFEAGRARAHFTEAMRHLSAEDRPLFIAALIMQEIYFRLLQSIEKAEYDVFTHRIRISTFRKLLITAHVWRNNRSR
ncbi:MAG: presqualene diphosphate synthase HpnD [Bacteroidetes bacterium]|nr:MAG: presqualene diphosphate synthase HpnD [Bacteroidota bacterium]